MPLHLSVFHRYICRALLKVKDIWYVIFQHPDVLHTLPMFSYVFFSQSPEAAEWRLERHHFSGPCCSWTSNADELLLKRNTSAAICSWTVLHVTALNVFHYVYIYLYIYMYIYIYILYIYIYYIYIIYIYYIYIYFIYIYIFQR